MVVKRCDHRCAGDCRDYRILPRGVIGVPTCIGAEPAGIVGADSSRESQRATLLEYARPPIHLSPGVLFLTARRCQELSLHASIVDRRKRRGLRVGFRLGTDDICVALNPPRLPVAAGRGRDGGLDGHSDWGTTIHKEPGIPREGACGSIQLFRKWNERIGFAISFRSRSILAP